MQGKNPQHNTITNICTPLELDFTDAGVEDFKRGCNATFNWLAPRPANYFA